MAGRQFVDSKRDMASSKRKTKKKTQERKRHSKDKSLKRVVKGVGV